MSGGKKKRECSLLRRDLPGHTVESAPLIGWAGLKNSALLTEAEKSFEVLLTMDSNLAHQLGPFPIPHRSHRIERAQQSSG